MTDATVRANYGPWPVRLPPSASRVTQSPAQVGAMLQPAGARNLSEAPRAMVFMIAGRNGSYAAGTARDHELRPLCLMSHRTGWE